MVVIISCFLNVVAWLFLNCLSEPPITPIELCNKYVAEFQSLNSKLSISHDSYARTTHPQHEQIAAWLWKQAAAAGDIYLGNYEGWYSTREEKFLTETEAAAVNYMDGSKPLQKTSEPSYFFRMGRYQERLIQHIQSHPQFILPLERANEILDRLAEPLHVRLVPVDG